MASRFTVWTGSHLLVWTGHAAMRAPNAVGGVEFAPS
jgi:hypothetical protein